MPSPLLALVIFACWTLLLVGSIGTWRSILVLAGKKRPNGFKSGEEHGGDLYWRLNRAHMNAVETIGPFAALVLAAWAADAVTPTVTACAWVVTGARFCQTFAHLSSGRSISVSLRFTFFLAQLFAMLVIGFVLVVTLAGPGAGTGS
jgi:hypothetical protein